MYKTCMLFLLYTVLATRARTLADATASTNPESNPHSKCELLKTSLTYSQENAPRDISGVLPLIVERVNRELSGVVDVEVLFTGSEIHSRVGNRTVQCSVTRLLSAVAVADSDSGDIHGGYERGVDEEGRDVVTQCFFVPFTITDVNECKVPVGHVMRHKCVDPAVCVNTLGSYHCICPMEGIRNANNFPETADETFWESKKQEEQEHKRSAWELSLGSVLQSTCPSKSSTHQCCDQDARGSEGSSCRAGFRCPIDPCQSFDTNTCVSTASCQRADNPLEKPSYNCVCPEGLLGNGHKCRKGIDPIPVPKVGFDKVTPTGESKNFCGCTKPIVDPCVGFPTCEGKNEVCTVNSNTNEPSCQCKPGFEKVPKFGCVDETPPILKLRHDPRGDKITLLKQGDTYKEHALDVIDENAEDYLRSLKIAYSRPLPPSCLAEIGSFQVNYTVALPWANPPYVRVTRNVIIEDINECTLDVEKYETQCPQLIPQCDITAGAVCENTNGSYTCRCPEYTSGDGFKFISSVKKDDGDGHFIGGPVGYNGGTGCKDTSKPVIHLRGPNPKIFRISKCGGLSGVIRATKNVNNERDEKMIADQRGGYGEDIAKIIRDTAGAELCATHSKNNPKAIDCIKAIDHTYKGDVDISTKVNVGTPVQVSEFEWKIPYNVMDDAGNAAEVVWRKILVKEVELSEIEEQVLEDVHRDRQREIDEAVRIAVQAERKRLHADASAVKQKQDDNNHTCPACATCDCAAVQKGLSIAECDQKCEQKLNKARKTCNSDSRGQGAGRTLMHSLLDYFVDLTEGILSPNFAGILLVSFLVVFFVFVAQRIVAVNQGGWQYYDAQDDERERDMLSHVTYFNGNSPNIMRPPNFAEQPRNVEDNSVAGTRMSIPPRGSNSMSDGGIFSATRPNNPPFASPREGTSIYQNERSALQSPMSPITPGSNVHRQHASQPHTTPYSLRRRNY